MAVTRVTPLVFGFSNCDLQTEGRNRHNERRMVKKKKAQDILDRISNEETSREEMKDIIIDMITDAKIEEDLEESVSSDSKKSNKRILHG